MKILFVSHSYPPIWGGVESQNFNLAENLKKITDVKIIANGRGKKYLPIFLPVALAKILYLMPNYDACLLGNGVLAPWGAIAKMLFPQKKYFCVVHGLDITYAGKKGFLSGIYKHINIPALKKIDKLIMVGNATIDEAVKAGIKREQCKFIPNGIDSDEFSERHEKKELSKILKLDPEGKKIIFRLARFVPHKGTSWFIERVMPKLPENVIMVAAGARIGKHAAGDQDDFLHCKKIAREKNLESQVILIPFISEGDKKILLNTADLTVSPNIKIPGTMEGFGINVLEAAVCERVVVASQLEGLMDAVKEGENGFLVESENVDAWVAKISELLADDEFRRQFGKRAKKYTLENFSWDKIARRYLKEMDEIEN